jgi:hypothetical protein
MLLPAEAVAEIVMTVADFMAYLRERRGKRLGA